MKPQAAFVAERAAAQHCPELLRRGPAPADLIPALAGLGERLACALGPALEALLGCEAPQVSALPPAEIGKADLIEQASPLGANILLACAVPGLGMIASIDGISVLRLVDRAFGGKGEAPAVLPPAFPLSAELMTGRLEGLILDCLGEALALPDLRVSARNPRMAELARFPAATRLAQVQLAVAEDDGAPWHVRIAVPMGQLPELLARCGAGQAPARRSGLEPRAADPAAAPFADVPLPLTATLVDMRVPLSALARLEPGCVLPVAVARSVPLSAGDTVLASGTIGAAEDRVAIKLTTIA